MATNKQREASRRQLEQQLRERQAREARRKRTTLIGSVVGSVAILVIVIVIIVATTSGGGKKKPKAVVTPGRPTASSTSPTPTPKLGTPTACAKPPKGATATFDGVTVGEATNLKHEPKVGAKGTKDPTALACEDLVVGKGKPASSTSQVTVQYTGVLYKDGTEFDSSWAKGGQPVPFDLTRVVPGFTQGIGGTGKVAPMRVGGRRIIVMPAVLGYGASGSPGAVPPNAALVFVVDLTSISS